MRLPFRLKTILLASVVVALSFFASLKALDWLSPSGAVESARGHGVAAIAAGVAHIRHPGAGLDLDRGDPRRRRSRHAAQLHRQGRQPGDRRSCRTPISAGPLRAARSPRPAPPDVLTLATPLTGTINVTGSLSSKATGAVSNALGSLLGDKAAKQIGSINIKDVNAHAEIKGNVTITSRPKLAAAWHFEPNLAGPGQSRRHQPFGGRRQGQRARRRSSR